MSSIRYRPDQHTRPRHPRTIVAWLVLAVLVGTFAMRPGDATAAPSVTALPRAHAHNDYLHDRPLYDALAQGFTSVEADVYPLVFGELPVGHFPWDIRPQRTLRSLYLDPLRQLVADNHGTVIPGYDGEFQLLIEIKWDATGAYRELEKLLGDPRYDGLFTRYVDGRVIPGPVTVSLLTAFISGTELRATMAAQTTRSAFLVGTPGELGNGIPATLMPEINADWTTLFRWHGEGLMPDNERRALIDLVDRAHREGKRIRFWGVPDQPGAARKALWDTQFDTRVDRLATDHPADLAAYLHSRTP
ncbi:hypothetical protein [Nocardia brasiliensis]|uniref:hypothetical protein n=1 Tax=Nocardia brasiliensis TaxID=37326 RepID=UPI00189451E0|nr:hypothetical protein [Nocardia brasiliensis]MBF6546853.1 hypothetical protein [Nocardia brasiliensis]